MRQIFALIILIPLGLSLAGCGAKIMGTVRLVDKSSTPIPGESPQGVVVNMINTTASLENASASAVVDAEGNFKSDKGTVVPGVYKVEVSRIGYKTATQTVEVAKNKTMKLELFLKKISEGSRKSIRNKVSDEDKIINPGEVNIQPPQM